jgi:hypothetical protein
MAAAGQMRWKSVIGLAVGDGAGTAIGVTMIAGWLRIIRSRLVIAASNHIAAFCAMRQNLNQRFVGEAVGGLGTVLFTIRTRRRQILLVSLSHLKDDS